MSNKKMIEIKVGDADSLALNTQPTLIVLEILKKQIVEGNIASALEKLHILTDTEKNTRLYKNSLILMVEGYDSDERELVEIPQVREFFQKLNREWPHWLWFLNQDMGSIGLLFALLCEVKVSRGKNGYFTEFRRHGEIEAVLEDMLTRGEVLFQTYKIEENEVEEMMNGIAKALQL